jgi:type VI secretion system protein ImpM
MEVGFYGKLPSHGDFLRRRASDAFVDVWDGWLGECLAASRSSLGERWLEVYLESPVWRFVCGPGACGPVPVVGLMAPSVDQVGRYFPLTLVSELPEYVSVLTAATAAASFFDSAERLVIEMLDAEHVDFESFDARVLGLRDELGAVSVPPRVMLDPAAVALFNENAQSWQIPLGSLMPLATVFGQQLGTVFGQQLGMVFEQLISLRLSATYHPLVLWWTKGSDLVDPSCLITKGLPHAGTFAALLDGSWAQHRWRSVPAHVEPDPLSQTLADDRTPLRFRSAAATDVGRARGNNEDGFVERPEIGLWAVADGMGGHSDGEIASRMVCDALADFEPDASFEDTVEAARERMQEVNDHLLRTAARSLLGDRSGSTVVVLLVRGLRAAVLWAGDSRVYRWRAGRLEQLSRDHSLAELEGTVASEESNVITRAVGVQPALTLDLHPDTVRVHDRFLLCSDGLTRVVPEDQIRVWMEQKDIRVAIDGLIKATLDAGAPDNVTVVIVEAYV